MAKEWFELIGDKELSAKMVELGEKVSTLVVDEAAREWGKDVAASAERRAPVLTGKLSRKIDDKVTHGTAEVISDAVNEHGHSYAAYVELGTGHGPAQPYLYPAFIEHRDLTPYVRAELAKVVDL